MNGNNTLITLFNQYLQEVLHCETQLFALRRFVTETEAQIPKLGIPNPSPVKPTPPPGPTAGETVLNVVVTPIAIVVLLVQGLFGGAIAGAIIGAVFGYFFDTVGDGAIMGGFIVGIIGAVFSVHDEYSTINKHKREKYEAYQAQMQTYSNAIQVDNSRVITELQKKESLSKQLSNVYELISNIEDTLSKLYDIGIIHPKYRNITAVSSFYDYFSTGRTYSLVRTGVDPGAYNIYEEDVRANKIVNAINLGFDRISSQLSSIQTYQYCLYSAVLESKGILQNISNKIDAGNQIQEKSAYFVQETANNTRIMVDLNRDRWGDLRNLNGQFVSG